MTGRSKQTQRGGFLMGLVVGLLTGLALALAVALYVTKVPIPFINKVPPRTADRDAEERERNRNWDPNSPLYGNNQARPAAPGTAASGVIAPVPPTAPPVTAGGGDGREPATAADRPAAPATATAPPTDDATRGDAAGTTTARSTPASTGSVTTGTAVGAARDPASILSNRPPAPGDGLSTRPRDDPFIYFVQAGAYGRPEDAEQQRARLAMIGIETRVTEREQSGRTVYRVRVGPFNKRDQADAAKQRLEAAAFEAALVRVQK